MPELPEVETVVRSLSSAATHFSVRNIEFFSHSLREVIPQEDICKVALGKKILQVSRRGKYIILEFSSGSLIFHFGMTGKILLRTEGVSVFKHTHLIFTLSHRAEKNIYLHYVDPRRFGRLGVCLGRNPLEHPYLKELGVEPLANKTLGQHLYSAGHNSARPIKSLIMDSTIVVGVGNIYASEALFKARIHPLKLAKDLKRTDYLRLARAIQFTLKAAIKAGGTTFRDYQNLAGQPGYFALELSVYGRDKEHCRICKKAITKIKISGRSTYFCAVCQNTEN